jgi:hypothetical protein
MLIKLDHQGILNETLDTFVTKAGKKEMLGACIFVHGKIAAATSTWYAISSII